jgi:hypothetical protein
MKHPNRAPLTEALARAAGYDAGDRAMRHAGRTYWTAEDFNTAVRETNRLLDLIPATSTENPA